MENKNIETLNALKETWKSTIDHAKPLLGKEAGWSNLLANLLLVIPTLGLLMAYTAYQTGCKNFLFPFIKSDVLKVAEQLEQVKETLQVQPTYMSA